MMLCRDKRSMLLSMTFKLEDERNLHVYFGRKDRLKAAFAFCDKKSVLQNKHGQMTFVICFLQQEPDDSKSLFHQHVCWRVRPHRCQSHPWWMPKIGPSLRWFGLKLRQHRRKRSADQCLRLLAHRMWKFPEAYRWLPWQERLARFVQALWRLLLEL